MLDTLATAAGPDLQQPVLSTVRALAELSGLNPATVQHAIRRLIAQGRLTTQRNTATSYRVITK